MKKILMISAFALMLSGALTGCNPNNNNNTAAAIPQACVNSPYTAPTAYGVNNQPNCVTYGTNSYPGGCPPGYAPMQTSGYFSQGGIACMSMSAFQGYYGGWANMYTNSYSGYWGTGPSMVQSYQTCDATITNSCGTTNGLHCLPYYNSHYGFCGQ